MLIDQETIGIFRINKDFDCNSKELELNIRVDSIDIYFCGEEYLLTYLSLEDAKHLKNHLEKAIKNYENK